MDETNPDQSDRSATIRQWIAENEIHYGYHPCFADLVSRIRSIERLEQAAPVEDLAISLSVMTLTVQLDRCESVIESLRNGKIREKRKEVEQILYPSLPIAVLQRIIHLIVGVKNRLGISDKTYSSAGLLHLCYIKSPPGLTAFISRILPRIW